MRGRDRGRHLHHPWVQIAGIGVNFAQGIDLDRKTRARNRIIPYIKLAIGALRGRGHGAAAIAHGQPRGLCRPAQRGFGQLGAMGIARDLATDRAQTESLGCVIAGRFDPAIIQDQRFRPPPFQKQFAIIAPRNRIAKDRQGGFFV